MGSNIRLRPGIEFQSVKSDAARPNWYLCKSGPYLGVENVARHCQVAAGIPCPDDSGKNLDRHGRRSHPCNPILIAVRLGAHDMAAAWPRACRSSIAFHQRCSLASQCVSMRLANSLSPRFCSLAWAGHPLSAIVIRQALAGLHLRFPWAARSPIGRSLVPLRLGFVMLTDRFVWWVTRSLLLLGWASLAKGHPCRCSRTPEVLWHQFEAPLNSYT